ncbi:uncharacterized protein [Clytia hemisphaerica]|uniref:uncharacterized protein n=1 Tax=Clytia hemisphaerica TaxID=252671 RepID=UPI0034D754F8
MSPILVTILLLSTISNQQNHVTAEEIVIEYFEMKPYIFTDPKTGHLTGMLIQTDIEMRREGVLICNVSSLPSYKYVKSTFEEVHRKWENAFNATPSSARYLCPIVKKYASNMTETLPVFTSETISVITLKYWMEGSWKFFQTLYDLNVLIVFGAVGQFAWAFVLLATEITKDVPKGNVIRTIGKHIWFATVTSSSVGYGDVIPKRLLSKVIVIIYMIFGMIVAAILFGFMAESYKTTRHYEVYDTTVNEGNSNSNK